MGQNSSVNAKLGYKGSGKVKDCAEGYDIGLNATNKIGTMSKTATTSPNANKVGEK